MSCNTTRFTKKKIILLSSLVLGVSAATYSVITATYNTAVAAVIPAISVFAICPAMCAAVGGIIWATNRFSSKKDSEVNRHELTSNKHEETERDELACRSAYDDDNYPSKYST